MPEISALLAASRGTIRIVIAFGGELLGTASGETEHYIPVLRPSLHDSFSPFCWPYWAHLEIYTRNNTSAVLRDATDGGCRAYVRGSFLFLCKGLL